MAPHIGLTESELLSRFHGVVERVANDNVCRADLAEAELENILSLFLALIDEAGGPDQVVTLLAERYPPAPLGEERLFPLVVTNGPSLYLVSDGAGVVSPPHHHATWAVIVGLAGVERNTAFEIVSQDPPVATAVSTRDLGAGDSHLMTALQIHGTFVPGNESSYHLHLYGRALNSLASFPARCFSVDQASTSPSSSALGSVLGSPFGSPFRSLSREP